MDTLSHLEMQTGLARATAMLKEEQARDPQGWMAGYYAGRVSVFRQMLLIEEASDGEG